MHCSTGAALFGALLLSQGVLAQMELFVATWGSASAPGTEQQPMDSLGTAIHEIRSSGTWAGSTVWIASGLYEQTAVVLDGVSGTASSPFRIAPWNSSQGELAVLSGGRAIPAESWQKVVLDQAPQLPAFRSQIGNDSSTISAITNIRVYSNTSTRLEEAARFPDASASMPYTSGFINVGGAPMRPPRVVDNISFSWEIDVNSNSLHLPWPEQEEEVLTTMWPGTAGFNFQGAKTQLGGQPQPDTTILWIDTGGATPDSPYALRPGDRFFFTNALRFLDQQREWFYDPADGGWLYYIPDMEFAPFPNGSTVVIPNQSTILTIRESENIVLQGVQLSDTPMKASGYFDREKLPADPAVSVSSSTNISFVQGCRWLGLGGSALVIGNASASIVVSDAVIDSVGQSGVVASGAGSGHGIKSVSVMNSRISNTGRILSASAGILLDGVETATVSGNTILNSTGWGIMVRAPSDASAAAAAASAGSVTISDNHIAHSSLASDGTAGIGILGGTSWHTVSVLDNCVYSTAGVVSDIKGLAITPANAAIISLQAASHVSGNVLSSAGMAGVLALPGSNGSIVTNNVVASVAAPAAVTGVLQAGAALIDESTISDSVMQSNIILQLDASASLIKAAPGSGVFGRNLFFNPNATIASEIGRSSQQPIFPTGNWSSWEAQGGAGSLVDLDPLFQDWKQGRFVLQAGSPATKIGFKPLQQAAAKQCGILA